MRKINCDKCQQSICEHIQKWQKEAVDKLHRRNLQIKDLKTTVEKNFKLYEKACQEIKKYSDYVFDTDLSEDFKSYLAEKGLKVGFDFHV